MSRHSNDGKPYFCTHCGSGHAEFLVCEDVNCCLETEEKAAKRRNNFLLGVARRDKKNVFICIPVDEAQRLIDTIPVRSFPHTIFALVKALPPKILGSGEVKGLDL